MIGVGCLALLAILIVTAINLEQGGDDELCANKIEIEIASPDGNNKLVIFERDCGATTAISIQGMILRKGQKLRNIAGNTFVVDHSKVNATWTGNTTLSVIFDPKARVFRQNTYVDGITITYAKQEL